MWEVEDDRRRSWPLMAWFIGVILCWSGIVMAGEPSERYHPRQVLVKLDAGTTLQPLRKMGGLPVFQVTHEYAYLGRMSGARYLLLEVTDHTGMDIQKVVDRLQELPGVAAASLNVTRRLLEIPEDPLFPLQWGLRNTGQQAFTTKGIPDIDIDAPEAWAQIPDYPGTGESVIAVIDTGVDLGHPDLAGNIWINPGEIPDNGVDDDGNGYVDDTSGYDFAGNSDGVNDPFPQDTNDHGTHIAGIIAARIDNGVGVAGTGVNTRVMPLKIFHSESERSHLSDELEALEYALRMKREFHVNIVAINCSFGSDDFSALEYDALNQCRDAEIAVVCAAGNGGDDNVGDNTDVFPLYPASYDLDNIISVTSIDNRGQMSDFSNFGITTVDFAAPGTGIMSTFRRGKGSEAMVLLSGEIITAFSLDFGGYTTGVTGFLVDCGRGITISDFPAGVRGNLALIERGDIYFSEKVTNAQNAGAVAAIVYNNEPGHFTGTLQAAGDWIPVLAISREDGLRILTSFALSPATVINRAADYGYKSGTSMAAPFASGALALLDQKYPNEDMNRRLARVILGLAPLDTLRDKTRYGAILKLPHSDIHPPVGVSVHMQTNQSLFTTEYTASISFRPNPLNRDFSIQSYRVYQVSGADLRLVSDLPAQVDDADTEYRVLARQLKKGTGNLYAVVAVAENGEVGAPGFAE